MLRIQATGMVALLSALLAALLPAGPAAAQSSDGVTYKCPGNAYTNLITAQEAKSRGCTTIEGAPITIIQTAKPRPIASPSGSSGSSASAPRNAETSRVDPGLQRQRDTDARAILEAELRKEEGKLADLKKDYNDGQPERRGDERNYARYEERVAELKAAILRKEADIAAIKREIGKLAP